MATSELKQQQHQGTGTADSPQGIAPADAQRYHSLFAGVGGNRLGSRLRCSGAVVLDSLI